MILTKFFTVISKFLTLTSSFLKFYGIFRENCSQLTTPVSATYPLRIFQITPVDGLNADGAATQSKKNLFIKENSLTCILSHPLFINSVVDVFSSPIWVSLQTHDLHNVIFVIYRLIYLLFHTVTVIKNIFVVKKLKENKEVLRNTVFEK